MKKILRMTAALICGLSVFCFAEKTSTLNDAEALIRSGKCAAAIPGLQKISTANFTKPDGEKASVLLAECELLGHQREEAAKVASRFLEYYPVSAYRERMEVVSAALQIEGGSVYSGMEKLLRIMVYTKNPAAYDAAKKDAIQTLAASLLSSEELFALLAKSKDKEVNDWIALQLARETQNQGRVAVARHWYRKVIDAQASASLVSTAKQGLASLQDRGAGMPTVLVLVPVSGEYAEFGTEAVRGVLLAFEENGFKDKVHLRIADTRADAATALSITREAVEDDSVIAVIGPLMSAPAAAVAAWPGTAHPEIPMLTPTATDEGIAAMGPNVFQINITMGKLAESIADYAMTCLGIREFAVLSPLGDYGNTMSRSFMQAVENRGGTILVQQKFEEGHADYKTECDLLKNVRYKQEVRRRNIQKGVENLDASNAKDRKAYMQDTEVQFPGIFIPSSTPADAGLIVSQLAFNKVSGPLLGTSGWYGRNLISQGKNLVEGTYFSVPSVPAEDSAAYKKFSDKFQKRWNEEPRDDKVSGLSYTAAAIVIKNISAGSSIVDGIRGASAFPGVYGDVKFKNGANDNARILTVTKGQFTPAQSCGDAR